MSSRHEGESSVTIVSNSAEDTSELGCELGEALRGGEIVLLTGPLGSGKTTLVKGLARGLGVHRNVTSPSFVLEKTYEGRRTLRHIDLYRLDAREAFEFWHSLETGPDEILAVEWGERISDLVEGTIRVNMEYCENPDARVLTVSWNDPAYGEIVRQAVSRWRERISR